MLQAYFYCLNQSDSTFDDIFSVRRLLLAVTFWKKTSCFEFHPLFPRPKNCAVSTIFNQSLPSSLEFHEKTWTLKYTSGKCQNRSTSETAHLGFFATQEDSHAKLKITRARKPCHLELTDKTFTLSLLSADLLSSKFFYNICAGPQCHILSASLLDLCRCVPDIRPLGGVSKNTFPRAIFGSVSKILSLGQYLGVYTKDNVPRAIFVDTLPWEQGVYWKLWSHHFPRQIHWLDICIQWP